MRVKAVVSVLIDGEKIAEQVIPAEPTDARMPAQLISVDLDSRVLAKAAQVSVTSRP